VCITRSNWRDFIVWPIIITLVAFGVISDHRQKEDLKSTQSCNVDLLIGVVTDLNARAALSPELNAADANRAHAQGEFLETLRHVEGVLLLGSRELNKEEKITFHQDLSKYLTAVDDYLVVLDAVDNSQENHQFPTKADYQACLNN
jgi:hypothetical protein